MPMRRRWCEWEKLKIWMMLQNWRKLDWCDRTCDMLIWAFGSEFMTRLTLHTTLSIIIFNIVLCFWFLFFRSSSTRLSRRRLTDTHSLSVFFFCIKHLTTPMIARRRLDQYVESFLFVFSSCCSAFLSTIGRSRAAILLRNSQLFLDFCSFSLLDSFIAFAVVCASMFSCCTKQVFHIIPSHHSRLETWERPQESSRISLLNARWSLVLQEIQEVYSKLTAEQHDRSPCSSTMKLKTKKTCCIHNVKSESLPCRLAIRLEKINFFACEAFFPILENEPFRYSKWFTAKTAILRPRWWRQQQQNWIEIFLHSWNVKSLKWYESSAPCDCNFLSLFLHIIFKLQLKHEFSSEIF